MYGTSIGSMGARHAPQADTSNRVVVAGGSRSTPRPPGSQGKVTAQVARLLSGAERGTVDASWRAYAITADPSMSEPQRRDEQSAADPVPRERAESHQSLDSRSGPDSSPAEQNADDAGYGELEDHDPQFAAQIDSLGRRVAAMSRHAQTLQER